MTANRKEQESSVPPEELAGLAYNALLRYANELWKPGEKLLPELMRRAKHQKENP